MNKKVITILGCGASGIATFIQLVQLILLYKLSEKIKIIIIDKQAIPHGGIAYETPHDCNLLNITPLGMSIVANNKEHFYQWLLHYQTQDYNITHNLNTYYPRKLYGIYLKDSFQTTFNLAKKIGLEVDLILDDVINLNSANDGYELFFKHRRPVISNYVVLCVGGFDKRPLLNLIHPNTYFSSPYSSHASIMNIPKSEPIFIAGTRLSAIDSILMLKAAGHQGKIMCISRQGQLPRVQGKYHEDKTPTILNENTIDKLIQTENMLHLNQIFSLIRCETELQENIILDCEKIFKLYRNQTALLQKEIELSQAVRPWQSSIFKTNAIANKIWINLKPSDQNHVFKKYLNFFTTYRSAMPLTTATKIHTFLQNKSVAIFQSKSPFTYDEKTKLYSIEVNGFPKKIYSSYLINATGISSDISATEIPLIQNLLHNNIITKHRLSGCNADPHTLKIQHSLYAIGALTQGVHIATSLLEHLVSCSSTVANDIIKNI